MFRLTFLGATGTVTGSKYLVETDSRRILVDCGLFQGYKQLRLRNWAPFPVSPENLDAVVLTHAHLDHSGYIPLLVKNGFSGPIYSSSATRDLCGILLPDSGYLQEEQARYANKRGFSKHKPALPLYTQEDAEKSLDHFIPVAYDTDLDLGGGLALRMIPSGHILGSAFVVLSHGGTTLAFSGDLGRFGGPTMNDPRPIHNADYLVMESTYGDRLHEEAQPLGALAEGLAPALERGGVVVIPSFAVGRAQTLLFLLSELKKSNRIPDVPVYLNSPMAVNASRLFCAHLVEHRLTPEQCHDTCNVAKYVNSVEESKTLNTRKGPMILLSASGMATGGRVLHHLKAFAPDPNNTILFAGFQAGGTRGAALVRGAKEIKIHGEIVPVRARVLNLNMLSAHADYQEILRWLSQFNRPPRRTFITHGEPAASDALRGRIEERLEWACYVPDYKESVVL